MRTRLLKMDRACYRTIGLIRRRFRTKSTRSAFYRLASLKRNFWSVASAGFVQEDFVAEMQVVIAKKDALIASYQTCSEYWLLIAAEGNRASTFFCPSRTTLEHRYCSAFQRIFFLEAFTKKVSELE